MDAPQSPRAEEREKNEEKKRGYQYLFDIDSP
jgi:hypothetical protein